MEKNHQRIYKIIMLIIITIIITSLVTAFGTYNYLTKTGSLKFSKEDTSLSGLEYTLAMFRNELEKKYIGEINDDELIDGAIKGYVAALNDPYTVYYTKKEMEEIMESTNGNFVGIGIYMTQDKESDGILIINPMEGSPAEKAGILPGDIITKVDDQKVTGDQLELASNKIKGKAGTKVKLEILRNNQTKEFEIERATVYISHITAEIIENDIGYMLISDFDGDCAKEFEKKYKELEQKGIKRLIIDIRNNGGGIVDESTKIADFILEKDSKILITKDKNNNEEVTRAKSKPMITMPVVLLTNEYSASASEILTAALKENGKATIVGTKTYGKGVIQELHSLTDGSGLKITISEYFTPNHNKINKVGIEPDVNVELSDEVKAQGVITRENDNQLKKAIEIIRKVASPDV